MAPKAAAALGMASGLAMAGSAAVPVPYAQQIGSVAAYILNHIKLVYINKSDLCILAQELTELAEAVRDSEAEGPSVSASRVVFQDALLFQLAEIRRFVDKITRRPRLRRILFAAHDAAVIQEFQNDIRRALRVFGIKSQLKLCRSTEEILHRLESLQARSPPLPPPAPSPLPWEYTYPYPAQSVAGYGNLAYSNIQGKVFMPVFGGEGNTVTRVTFTN